MFHASCSKTNNLSIFRFHRSSLFSRPYHLLLFGKEKSGTREQCTTIRRFLWILGPTPNLLKIRVTALLWLCSVRTTWLKATGVEGSIAAGWFQRIFTLNISDARFRGRRISKAGKRMTLRGSNSINLEACTLEDAGSLAGTKKAPHFIMHVLFRYACIQIFLGRALFRWLRSFLFLFLVPLFDYLCFALLALLFYLSQCSTTQNYYFTCRRSRAEPAIRPKTFVV